MSKYETNLNAATTRFWNSLYFHDQHVLQDLLSPDCHIMLKSTGTGCIGITECLKILNEIQNRMKIFETQKGKLRFTMKLNKVKRSARFLITPIDHTLKFHLGFQLEWECGIVIGIKVVEDPSPGFLVIKKTGKVLSDMQNTIIRQQTGPSHYEWRQRSHTLVTGFVLPKDTTVAGPGTATTESPSYESKSHFTFDQMNDLTEIHLIPLPKEFEEKSDEVEEGVTSSATPSPPAPPQSFIYPGDDLISSSSPSLNTHNSKLKFSPRTEALLVPERSELPCKELFYGASDFQLFAIDYGDEIKEIMMTKRVSPQQAIAMYHSIPLRNPRPATPAAAAGETGGADGAVGDNLEDDLNRLTEDEKKSFQEGEGEGEIDEDDISSDPPPIPPVLLSSLKAEVEHERQRRDSASSEKSQAHNYQRRGWYPGKILGKIKASVVGEVDPDEESRPRTSSVTSASSGRDTWYPGKFLGKLRGSSYQKRVGYSPEGLLEETDTEREKESRKNSSPSASPSSSSAASSHDPTIPEGFNDLLQTHSSVGSSPKFFIALTIIGCNNLKSPLKRVITRPINSSVQVIINEEPHASTEIICNSRHPRYQENNTFMFAIQPHCATEGYIEFVVTHKGLIDYEMMGMVRLPFAGISMQKDCQSPDYLLLPLTSRTANIYSIGKGFHSFSKEFIANSSDPSHPTLEGVVFHDSSGMDYNATEVPSLFIRVHKVNIRQIYNEKKNGD